MSLFTRIWNRDGLSWLWIGRESRALGFSGSGEMAVMPFSSAHPTWLVIPPELSKSILFGLPISHKFSDRLEEYLTGKISGEALSSTGGDPS